MRNGTGVRLRHLLIKLRMPKSALRSQRTDIQRNLVAFITTALALLLSSTTPVSAAPAGTVPIYPTMQACHNPATLMSRARCAGAYVNTWLAATNNRTVSTAIIIPNGVGLWRSTSTATVCGHASAPGLQISLHHCNHTTFINPVTDQRYFATVPVAIVALVHESAHALQERHGIDPVAITLSLSPDRLLPLERSADCWAGAAFRWYLLRGMLTRRELNEAVTIYRHTRTSFGHGTQAQRRHAFWSGYQDGVNACNRFLGASAYSQPLP